VTFTIIAVAIAFLLFTMPAERRDYAELAIAALLAVALIAIAIAWSRFPTAARFGIPIGYVVLAALLRDGAGGSTSGFGGLFLVPVLWLALTGGGAELLAVLVAVVLAQVIPLLAVGAPWYPPSGWRSVVVLSSVAAITGLMVQRLVRETRARAVQLQEQTSSLVCASTRLELQNERLLELDRMKDDFIAVVSHELRTPLTSIAGYLEMALDSDDKPIPPTQEGYLLIAQRNVSRLMALVNQLLFLERAKAHGFELAKQPVDLAQVIREAAETARPAAETRSVELQVDVSRAPRVLADRGLIMQLVDNLVSNAVKFTPPGGRVELAVRPHGQRVVVAVSDTGAGIAADELPKLFTPFFRSSKATRDAVGGTGLGLAISRLIAEAHGTGIDVESTPGRGTTFRFKLPALPAGSEQGGLHPREGEGLPTAGRSRRGASPVRG
jgi:signal transduction histidine kinase